MGKQFDNRDWATHPGEYLAEVIDARKLDISDLASTCNISIEELNQILAQQAAMSADLAVELEHELGINAQIFMGMQTKWQILQARKKKAKPQAAE